MPSTGITTIMVTMMNRPVELWCALALGLASMVPPLFDPLVDLSNPFTSYVFFMTLVLFGLPLAWVCATGSKVARGWLGFITIAGIVLLVFTGGQTLNWLVAAMQVASVALLYTPRVDKFAAESAL